MSAQATKSEKSQNMYSSSRKMVRNGFYIGNNKHIHKRTYSEFTILIFLSFVKRSVIFELVDFIPFIESDEETSSVIIALDNSSFTKLNFLSFHSFRKLTG
jgi:hypothetical protein